MRLLVPDTLKCLLIACCIAFGILGATHALAKSERQINPHDGYKWGKEDWNRGIRAHVREDYELAFKLFSEVAKLKATDLGEEDRHLIPYSEYILGLMYFHGQGVSKDYNKAHKLWTKLQGTFGPATFNVAVLMCKDWYGNHKNAWFFFKLAEQLGAPKGDCKSDLLNIFMESSSNPSFKPKPPEKDEFICKGATKIDGNWESGSNYQQFVQEAEDRSLTLARCSELTGRPNPNQISEQISEKDLCITATKPTGAWEKNYRYETYVQQAKDRNLTLERCSELTGRPNPEAAEPKSKPPSSELRSASDLNKMAVNTLCFGATKFDGNWEDNSVNEHYVREAKARNLTLSRCAELTGRPNPLSDSSRTTSSSYNESAKALFTYAPMSEKDLCMTATTTDGSWDTNYKYKKYVDRAKRENLTLEWCSELTGRPNPFAKPPQSPLSKANSKELDSIEVRLKKLKKLEDAGLITSEEAAEKRKEILRDM